MFWLWTFRFCWDGAFQVGDGVGGDVDELPSVMAGVVERINVASFAGQIVKVKLLILPLAHPISRPCTYFVDCGSGAHLE